MKSVLFRSVVVTGLIFLSTSSFAQAADRPEMTKENFEFKTGVKVSMSELMIRQSRLKVQRAKIKFHKDETDFRKFLPQNPDSPAIASSAESPKGFDLGIFAAKPADRGAPLFATVGTNFEGGNSTQGPSVTPPDTMGEVGPANVVVPLNNQIRIFNRTGTLISAVNTDVFFSSVVTAGSFTSDPRVRFDRLTNRWFLCAIDTASPRNRILLAVSDSDTLSTSTSWTFSFATAANNRFADYPTLGVDQNGVYIGINSFGGGYLGSDLWCFRKADAIAGTLVGTTFLNLSDSFTPFIADNDDPTATNAYFLAVSNANFGLFKFGRVAPSGGGFTFSQAITNLTVASTSFPVDQTIPGGSHDTIDDRMFSAKVFYDRVTNTRTLWTTQNMAVNSSGVATNSGTRTNGSRWYQIANINGTPTVQQFGTVFNTTTGFSIPTVAMNLQGHALMGFTASNSTTSPGVATSHRFASDASGTMTAPTVRQAGTGTFALFGTPSRWGDYSNTVVDPRNGMTIWTFQEYVRATNSWAVRAIELKAPAPTLASVAPTAITQGQSATYTLTGTGLFDPGAGYPDRLAVSVSGTGVAVSNLTWVSPTSVTMTLTATAGATTGSRTITLTNPDGQTATTSLTVNAQASVAGTITFEDFPPSTKPQVTVQIRNNSTGALIETTTVTPNSSGAFSFNTAVPAGTYRVWVKPSHRFLGKIQNNVTFTASGVSGLSFTLKNGDVNGDNFVSASDQLALRAAWGANSASSNWNPNADLNGDGNVGNSDFLIMRKNWGAAGDN